MKTTIPIAVLTLSLLSLSGLLLQASPAFAASGPEIKLYTLDCGHLEMKDLSGFSDTGEYDGKSGKLADPCFLIHHPKGWLLWDTGLGDALIGHPVELPAFGVRYYETVSLVDQLKELGLTPVEIDYVAFSHSHVDHTGNAGLFLKSKWLVQKAELVYAASASTMSPVNTQLAALAKAAHAEPLEGDHDVFGDGSVKILSTPGHTPGHQSLVLRLRHSGVVILSGDLYHLRDNVATRRVPVYNTSRAQTLASAERIERIQKNTKARLIVQHDAKDFNAMPKPPKYVD